MPTENRSSNTDPRDLFIRDNPLGLGEKELAKDRTGFADQRTHSDYLTFLAGYEAAQSAEQHHGEPVAWLNTATGNVTTNSVVVMDWDDEKEHVQSLYTHADPGEVERLKRELLVARAQGRAEVVEMITDLDAETGLDDFIGSHAIADTGDYGSHWNEAELREHFGVDEPAASELERCRYDGWQIIQLEEETISLRTKLAEQEHSARELLRIIGMSVQGSAAYNRAVIAFHDSLNADTKPN